MKKILLTVLSVMALVSCSDDEVTNANGPQDTIVGFTSKSVSQNYLNDATDAELVVPITLISYANEELPNEDITVSWEVLSSTDADAAVAGVEFDLPSGGSGTVVIPAGETTSSISINVHPITFDPDYPKKLTLLITSASNSIVGKQFEKIEITLQGICVSALAGEYVINYTSGPQPITITEIGPGSYRASYFPTFASVYWWEFSDVCGNLVITDWQFQASNPISGTNTPMPEGVVNPDGSITFTGVNVAGVSWYVDRTWTIYPN
ncbi:hypothetical protein [Flavobacterium sp.]|uniref:hypothetical protein n=1 Tax=Flavobacterium sp. TaxID=239 RepID=UPI0035281706